MNLTIKYSKEYIFITIRIRQFSGAMVLVAFFHVFLGVLDRIIYLRQNRTNIELDFVYYNTGSGERIREEEYRNLISQNKEMEKYFKVIYFQKEEVNYPLMAKYVLHIFVILFSHLFIFWYLPMQGNVNLNNNYVCVPGKQCNEFGSNFYIILFYLIYLVYIIFSAYQIHYGLPDMIKKNLFMRGDGRLYSYAYRTYTAIPFIYELTLLIDWTITPTSLDVFKWIKFEAVYDYLFITHCTFKIENTRKVGAKVTLIEKLGIGLCGFVAVLIILLGPLILFSNLNPTNSINNVNKASIDVSLTFDLDGVYTNFTLYANNQATSIKKIGIYMYFNTI